MRFIGYFSPAPWKPLFIASPTAVDLQPWRPWASRRTTKERVYESPWGLLLALVTTKLTGDDVRKAVELQIAIGRGEPGRLGAMRRSRKYAGYARHAPRRSGKLR